MSYLDKDGVLYLWGKIKALFNKGITGLSVNGRTITYTKGDGTTGTITTQDTNTTYSDMKGATNAADGTHGLVPAPTKGKQEQFLRGDGTWQTPANMTYSDMKGATASEAGTHGLAPAPDAGAANRYLRSDGTWQVPPDTNTTYSDFKAPTTDKAGAHGLVPAPSAAPPGFKFLCNDGAWNGFDQMAVIEDNRINLKLLTENQKQVIEFHIPVVGNNKVGLMTKGQSDKLDALPTNATLQSTYAKKSDLTNTYKYKGSVSDASKLPTSGQTTGDVYNIEAAGIYGGAGMNVAWNGSKWDPLGEIFTITAVTNTDLDAICV